MVGAPPMSLYTHFANKEELLDLMHAELSRRLFPDFGEPTWQGELSMMAFHIRRTLLSHPHWTELLSRPAPPSSVPFRERVLTLMVGAGMPAEQALQDVSSTILVALGLTLAELKFLDPDGVSRLSRRFDQLKTAFADEPLAAEAPTTRAAVAGPGSFDFEKTFALSLETLIRGFGGSSPP